ncbi:LpxA Acyl-[acyl carrier protein] [uncultured Caudovirales phage]|uniref:LpxA Acyl-[acyl carrier protein] n=1 Tax=uncultured Caudovirales phage TaxID=2100421 RepID=A0A6J5KP89_9CAUD|nr:LpxA Acyl-[acyl carrier protein] [uncultured Caudovirales phage]
MANFIHPTAIIYDSVTLGDNNYIGAYCIIGAPAEHKKYWGDTNWGGGVIIGDNNIITGLVTIDAGTEETTWIGNDCFIMKHAHIGHDCNIHSNVTISCGAKIGGHSIIYDKCNIGLNAVLHQWSIIQQGCMIGASAFFKGQSEIYTKYAGVPARKLGQNLPK